MTNWREGIELNAAIAESSERFDLSRHEEPMPTEAAERLACAVESSVWLQRFGRQIREAKSIAEVNRILASVFNEADKKLVWCGL